MMDSLCPFPGAGLYGSTKAHPRSKTRAVESVQVHHQQGPSPTVTHHPCISPHSFSSTSSTHFTRFKASNQDLGWFYTPETVAFPPFPMIQEQINTKVPPLVAS